MRPLAVLTLAGAVLLASCGAGADPGPSSTPTAAPPTSGTTLQTSKPKRPWNLVLQEVRVGEHPGSDRVVLHLQGSGTPGWAVRYVERAVLDGSGRVVRLDGDTILRLDVQGTPTTAESSGGVRTRLGGDVVDLRVVGAFEGVTQVFVGLAGEQTPFRVLLLSDPTRLVVDVDR